MLNFYLKRSIFLAEGVELVKQKYKGKNFQKLVSGNVYWGRPDWDTIFKNKALKFRANSMAEKKVGVFICGNYGIVQNVYDCCENYSSAAARFELNNEHF
jgi:hypothetical protein